MMAGRELDALVAERVMGFAHLISNHDGTVYFGHRLTVWNESRQSWDTDYIEVPLYSTSIEAAWTVVEKMGLWHGFEFIMFRETDPNDESKLIWRVGWFEEDYDGPESRVCAVAPTAPHAICLAALGAMEVGK